MKKIKILLFIVIGYSVQAQQLTTQQFNCGTTINNQVKCILGETFNGVYSVGNLKFGESILYQIANIFLNNESFKTKDIISVYPNPVMTALNVESKNNSNLEIKLFDILGKSIMITFENNTANVENLKSGIYFLTVLDKTIKQNQVIKIIKK